MTRSTIILDTGTNGNAQVTPDRFPANILITFEPQEQAEAFYGIDGQAPIIPLHPGQTKVVVDRNSLQLSYRVLSGQAKIEWDL